MVAKRGPKPKYNEPQIPDILAEVFRRMSLGESLLSICSDEDDFGCPPAPTIRLWVLNDTPTGIAAQYARARELQYEAWSDQIIDAADKPLIGIKRKSTAEGAWEETEGDNVDRARLKVDARKWILSKLAPKKYGDKVAVDSVVSLSDPLLAALDKLAANAGNDR